MKAGTLVLLLATYGANAPCAQAWPIAAQHEPVFRLASGVLTLADQNAAGDTIPRSRIEVPKLTHSVGPQAPGDLTGTSVVSTIVSLDGNPTEIETVHSLQPDYDRKAMEAVSNFRFKPATLDGHPTPMRVKVEIYFGR